LAPTLEFYFGIIGSKRLERTDVSKIGIVVRLDYCVVKSESNGRESEVELASATPKLKAVLQISSPPHHNTIRTRLPFKPGENRLNVEYNQPANVIEGGYGYFSGFGLKGERFWFD
jgi:hypothetical protein